MAEKSSPTRPVGKFTKSVNAQSPCKEAKSSKSIEHTYPEEEGFMKSLDYIQLPPEHKEDKEGKFEPDEFKMIVKMKNIYVETLKIDVETQQRMYKAEVELQSKHHEVYDLRLKALREYRAKHQIGEGGTITTGGKMMLFWARVMKAAYAKFVSKPDEKMLVYLYDVRPKTYLTPQCRFTLEFYFDPNPYFNNTVLTKTYYLQIYPDLRELLSFDGAEIEKCEGCDIDWKPPFDTLYKDNAAGVLFENWQSFFDFFSPPKLPADETDKTYLRIQANLSSDYELGFYLKERVIPKAILFFTGESVESFSSDDDFDESDEDESLSLSDCDDYEAGSSDSDNEAISALSPRSKAKYHALSRALKKSNINKDALQFSRTEASILGEITPRVTSGSGGERASGGAVGPKTKLTDATPASARGLNKPESRTPRKVSKKDDKAKSHAAASSSKKGS